jgi:hypothetical protein
VVLDLKENGHKMNELIEYATDEEVDEGDGIDEERLSSNDIQMYLKGEGISNEKLMSTIFRYVIPIASKAGWVRIWDANMGWYLERTWETKELAKRRRSRFQSLPVFVYWEPSFDSYACVDTVTTYGYNNVFENKRKYIMYNIDVLCRYYSGLKTFVSSNLFPSYNSRKRVN